MNSFLIFLIITLACASTVEAVCYAPAQNDASCMQKHGTYGYGCADDKRCYWTGANLYDYEGTCLAKETCVDNAVSTLSKGEKVQVGLLVTLVIPLLALIAVYMVLLAKSIIPTKDAAAGAEGGQDQSTTADTDEQEDQLREKRRWFGCCKKKAAEVTQEEAEEGVLVENENAVDAKEDEKKAPGDNQDEEV
jgi:hypothetical protein